jgi:rifampicin phosphotransferase
MAVDAFKTLNEITTNDGPVVGGKAFNCARLLQAGFPVPEGVVVPADATDEQIPLLARNPWPQSVPAGTLFAVRSSGIGEDSAGHSFAGIHETQLTVTREQLVEAVLTCRRSAQSPQALAYRQARQLGDDVRIGVLVQRMVDARVSGVAFTVNPITGADDIIINSAWGLGEALVGGQVDPDEFTLRKVDATVTSARLGAKGGDGSSVATLSSEQLAELAAILLRIEQHYGAPQDVEWCHDGRQFWIVQSRPVTTSSEVGSTKSEVRGTKSAIGTPNFDIKSAKQDVEWTRANLAEVFPEQLAPQVIDAYFEMLNRGQRMFMGRLLAPDAELGPMLKAFHGRMYMNLSQMRRVVSLGGSPAANMLRSLGHSGQIHPDDEIAKRAPLAAFLRCLPDFVRIGIKDARAEKILRQHEQQTRERIARLTASDPGKLSDRELWSAVQWWLATGPASIQIVFLMTAVLFRETMLRKACNAVGFPFERLVYPQLAAGERSVSTRQATDLVTLAEVARHEPRAKTYFLENDGSFADVREMLAGTTFLERFDQFLDLYGHRGRFESDWSIPRFHEDPTPLLFAVQGLLQDEPQNLKAVAERQTADAAAAWRAFEARLTTWQRWTLLPRVRSILRRLKKQYVWREQVRSDLTRILRHVRPYHLALAGRFVERGWIDRRDDYFLLHLDEVAHAMESPAGAAGLRSIVESRARDLAAQATLSVPLLMRQSDVERIGRRSRQPAVDMSGVLEGLCVSPGVAEAEVVVIRDPRDFRLMRAGAILVAPATDPSWTPLFTLASGVVVELGGMLSHASTVAREYGLPALANVKNATRRLRTGERVRLDATAGQIFRLPDAE